MPSHKIHIYIGNEVNKVLKLDKDLLLIGCILPDIINNVSHFNSHFKVNHSIYNTKLFSDKYLNDKNPALIGYLVHLLTDQYYNNYVKNNYFLFDENGKLNGIRMHDKIYYDEPEKICDKKQSDFTMYDNYLVRHNDFYIFKDNSFINKIPYIEECDYKKDNLVKYISEYNDDIKNNNNYNGEINYNFMNQEELDNLLNNCINYIIDYFKKNK